ncbi:uncharacterized protein DS421_2g54760 [Arachis hypogaea]|nr:uncharacterized protein DS421_2g54760 [Arachis hypogaea]
MARAPYALESDNRWLGGWAPETLLGGLEAARSDMARSDVAPETLLGGLEAARSDVAWSEVAPKTLLGGGWVVHRRWGFSSVRRWDLEELRKASIWDLERDLERKAVAHGFGCLEKEKDQGRVCHLGDRGSGGGCGRLTLSHSHTLTSGWVWVWAGGGVGLNF